MINLANNENLFPDKCFYLVNQSDNLSTFKNNKFDLIYTVITLQHIPTQLSTKFIQEFIRVLKPDGVLIFQVPSEFKADVPFIRKLVWQLLQKFPDFAVSFYRQKIKKTIPIEMYPINKSDVEKIINEANGKLIDINEDNLGGSNWVSYTYIVTK